MRSKTRDESEFVGMDRACSDNLVITAGDLCESMEELREQARQLSMLNGSLTDDLKAVEGELALYKERLLRERRRHPVPVFTSAPDISDCSGNQSKNIRRTSALKGKPDLGGLPKRWCLTKAMRDSSSRGCRCRCKRRPRTSWTRPDRPMSPSSSSYRREIPVWPS